jgi:hypothetical protein
MAGAVAKPWEANVTFRSVPAEMFRAFNEPDYIKIVWTLRADASGAVISMWTRAVATMPCRVQVDNWSFLSPGIRLIRRLLGPLVEAERRARQGACHVSDCVTESRSEIVNNSGGKPPAGVAASTSMTSWVTAPLTGPGSRWPRMPCR